MEILFLTTVLPGRRTTGGEMASQAIVEGLRASGHGVQVIGYRRPGDPDGNQPGEVAAGARAIETDGAPRTSAAGWMASAVRRGLPYSSAKYASRGYAGAARGLLRSGRFDLAIVDHAQTGWIVAEIEAAATPYVLAAHNVEQRLYADQAATRSGLRRALYAREARHMRRLEDGLARRAQAVWTLTEADAAHFLGLADTRTLTIPSGLDGSQASATQAKGCDVALLGTWTWDVTRGALEWFLDRVRPLIGERLTVEVAGRGGGWIDSGYDGVSYRGFVPDALEFLRSARVVAVPASGATGVQVKTLDAIASGAQVVASRGAARGLASPPSSLHVVDTEREFADALERLAGSPASLSPSREGIEWSRARRERLALELDSAVASALGSP